MKLICFDWGDTVMEELPGMFGPMAKWPRVDSTPGILTLLLNLHKQYKCCLATNASESDQTLVRAALARVELDGYFQQIFTSHDLHLQKPDERYFRAIEEKLCLKAEDCLMVGNSFDIDANGAADAGWNAIWLMRDLPSLRSHPLFGQVISEYAEFQTALDQIQANSIPSVEICRQMLANARIKLGLWRHVQKVALTGFMLACWLKSSGVEVDPIQVHRLGLLHDLDKPSLAEERDRHGRMGAQMIAEAGYPLLSRGVALHQVFSILDPDFVNESWETRLLFLADKMVEKDKLVGAEIRIDHLIQRYENGDGRMQSCKKPLLTFEREVAEYLGVDQDRILETLHRKIDGVDLEAMSIDE